MSDESPTTDEAATWVTDVRPAGYGREPHMPQCQRTTWPKAPCTCVIFRTLGR